MNACRVVWTREICKLFAERSLAVWVPAVHCGEFVKRVGLGVE